MKVISPPTHEPWWTQNDVRCGGCGAVIQFETKDKLPPMLDRNGTELGKLGTCPECGQIIALHKAMALRTARPLPQDAD